MARTSIDVAAGAAAQTTVISKFELIQVLLQLKFHGLQYHTIIMIIIVRTDRTGSLQHHDESDSA